MLPIQIRTAHLTDYPAITAIYAHHVQHGTASFEEVPPTQAQIQQRLQQLIEEGYPVLVAEHKHADGAIDILGYAYAGPYKPRSAYRFTVENSIYVNPQALGQGVGRQLLTQLVTQCRGAGFKQMMAIIGDSHNQASIGLHKRCGFQHVGITRSVGYKFERWLDVVLMQLSLSE